MQSIYHDRLNAFFRLILIFLFPYRLMLRYGRRKNENPLRPIDIHDLKHAFKVLSIVISIHDDDIWHSTQREKSPVHFFKYAKMHNHFFVSRVVCIGHYISLVTYSLLRKALLAHVFVSRMSILQRPWPSLFNNMVTRS